MALKTRKKFYDVEIPGLNSSVSVLAFSPEELENKMIKYDLTRILRGKNLVATLIIKNEAGSLKSEFKSLKITAPYIAKLMRTRVSYVEDSFLCNAKDSKIRIKPFLLTRKKVHRRVRTALRDKCRESIAELAKNRTKEEFFSEVISSKIQRQIIPKLKKIYPLSLCEIRVIEVEK